ncbi:MAG: cellulase family glycosylhydrolase [Flavobacteriaceae bacterium]
MRLCFLVLFLVIGQMSGQGFLQRSGQEIVNDEGAVLLKGIGTGNWMIQEGYMLQSTPAGINTQYQFRDKLIEEIGVDKTDEFYSAWLDKLITEQDLIYMKQQGFNSIRPALHYKWFTKPIEDEKRKVDGSLTQTYLKTGYRYLDQLVAWGEKHQMYVILDMHGAPGGQGKDANISDYDSSKPSLWESEENQNKLVELWGNLAERYKANPWVGGYDLINEPNWAFDDKGSANGCGCEDNSPIWDLYKRIIDEVRKVDSKHLIFIAGNCWGGNYESFESSGLATYDEQMSLTFHKYWDFNNEESISKYLKMREKYNLPLWMSEGGENSNQWFSEALALYESHGIGWSWWPVKKYRTNNILKVETPESYYSLINTWKQGKSAGVESTYQAVMAYAEAHKFENNVKAPDVVYAMIHAQDSLQTKPIKKHDVVSGILFADYDLGRDGQAYHDTVSSDYHASDGGDWTVWNLGQSYRNDGVDIYLDAQGRPEVGSVEKGEWLQYTFDIEVSGAYLLMCQFEGEVKAEVAFSKELVQDVDLKKVEVDCEISHPFILEAGRYQLRFYFKEDLSEETRLKSFRLEHVRH